MKFVLFVEGHTEQKALPAFLKRWLDPRLSQPVGIKTVRFEGWAHYVQEIDKKVALLFSGTTGQDVIAAIGLLDLYGPTFYPATASNSADRYAWAKIFLERQVNHQAFRQHFAVHEAEAWLLAEPQIFPAEVAARLAGRYARPEDVNFDTPPSKLLHNLYSDRLDRRYQKVIDGATLFQVLQPDAVYQRCRYLKALLDDLLSLAKEAGM